MVINFVFRGDTIEQRVRQEAILPPTGSHVILKGESYTVAGIVFDYDKDPLSYSPNVTIHLEWLPC